jgi:aminopeptidase YwaD
LPSEIIGETGFEFITFSSEEYLGLGPVTRDNNFTLVSGSNELQAHLPSIKNDFPAVQWTSPWYESNHYTFLSNDVPSIPFIRSGVSDLLHTVEDIMEWVRPDKLAEVYTLSYNFI